MVATELDHHYHLLQLLFLGPTMHTTITITTTLTTITSISPLRFHQHLELMMVRIHLEPFHLPIEKSHLPTAKAHHHLHLNQVMRQGLLAVDSAIKESLQGVESSLM